MRILKHPAAQIGAAAILGIAFGLNVGNWAANIGFVGDLFILDPPMVLGGSDGECSCGKQGWDCLRFSSAA